MARILIVVAVPREARALAALDPARARVVVAGVGRTNAAAATTEALLADGPFNAAASLGVAGALPPFAHAIGSALVASACVYAEEGLVAPDGFHDLAALGFPLGDFPGNAVPVDPRLRDALAVLAPAAPIATVATCSGTDAAAAEIARRTGAAAEAMEGAAVVHAARRLGVPGVELRTISNRTGDRGRQGWDLDAALAALERLAPAALDAMLDAVAP